jgi:hypothetical protein
MRWRKLVRLLGTEGMDGGEVFFGSRHLDCDTIDEFWCVWESLCITALGTNHGSWKEGFDSL